VNQVADLRLLLLNLTSFSKHVADSSSDHALFTPLTLRDLFSSARRQHTKALVKFCIDCLYEVASYDYFPHTHSTALNGGPSSLSNNTTNTSVMASQMITLDSESKINKTSIAGVDFQMCTGSIFVLIKVVGYIMRDQAIEREFLWE
jgi:hypothetical protein